MKVVAALLIGSVVSKRKAGWTKKKNDAGVDKVTQVAFNKQEKLNEICGDKVAQMSRLSWNADGTIASGDACTHFGPNFVQDGRCCFESVADKVPFDLEDEPKLDFWSSCAVLPYNGLDKQSGGCYRMPCPVGRSQGTCDLMDAIRACPECPPGMVNENGEGCCRRKINRRIEYGTGEAKGSECKPTDGTKFMFRTFDVTTNPMTANIAYSICMAHTYKVRDLCIRSECIRCEDIFDVGTCKLGEAKLHWHEVCPETCSAYNMDLFEEANTKITQTKGAIKKNKKKGKRRGRRLDLIGTTVGKCCKPKAGVKFERICCRKRSDSSWFCPSNANPDTANDCQTKMGKMTRLEGMRRFDPPKEEGEA